MRHLRSQKINLRGFSQFSDTSFRFSVSIGQASGERSIRPTRNVFLGPNHHFCGVSGWESGLIPAIFWPRLAGVTQKRHPVRISTVDIRSRR